MWADRFIAALAVVLCAGAGEAEGRYQVCYGEMAVTLLLEVSDGATRGAAETFVEGWMIRNEALLDAGFTAVTAAMLDDLNIDRRKHERAYTHGLRQWRDCLVRVYEAE